MTQSETKSPKRSQKKDLTTKKPGRGRPSIFTQAIADEICLRIADGEPLRQICRDDHMPAWQTVYLWQRTYKDFYERFAHARELGEDAIAQECLRIADDGTNDTYVDEQGRVRVDHDHIQRSKLRIETRLKLLAKWNPRKWGDRVDVNHGGQANNPVNMLLQQIQGTRLKPAEQIEEQVIEQPEE